MRGMARDTAVVVPDVLVKLTPPETPDEVATKDGDAANAAGVVAVEAMADPIMPLDNASAARRHVRFGRPPTGGRRSDPGVGRDGR